MFKKKHQPEVDVTDEPQEVAKSLPPENKFRTEAEENLAKVDRLRIEHAAVELGTTVAELEASRRAQAPTTELAPEDSDAHVRESIRESEKASHARH